MYISSARLTFYIPFSNSLKDKRQIRRHLIEKSINKFNASIAEVATHENHRTLSIGISIVSSEKSHAQNSLDEVIKFMEENTDADLVKVEDID